MDGKEFYDFDQSIEYRKGINYEFELPEGGELKIKTDTNDLLISKKENKLFIRGDYKWCAEPIPVKLFGVSQNSDDSTPMEIVPNYIDRGYSLEIILESTGEKIYAGTVTSFERPSKS